MRAYAMPTLVAYGRAAEITLGASGPHIDYVAVNGGFAVDANNPTCTTNVPYGAACVSGNASNGIH